MANFKIFFYFIQIFFSFFLWLLLMRRHGIQIKFLYIFLLSRESVLFCRGGIQLMTSFDYKIERIKQYNKKATMEQNT